MVLVSRFLLLLTAFLLCSAIAKANDSSAELAVGGLILTNSDAISLDREDLYISEKEVRVDYVFTNTSAKDIDTLVAFPFPDQIFKDEDDYFITGLDNAKISTMVDGKPLKLVHLKKAVLNNVDITEKVRKLNVPIDSNGEDFHAAVTALDPAVLAKLLQKGVIRKRVWDKAPLPFFPGWIFQSYYTRHQFFPAGKSIKVQHRYAPLVGGSVGGNLDQEDRVDVEGKERLKRYCPDDGFFKKLDQHIARSTESEYIANYHEVWLGYVLKSGANWKGPIKDFRLVVDTGDPNTLVSFCAEGIKSISPTKYEVRKKNFEPTRDLDILIVKLRTSP